jgi:hypothetical protein
MLSRLKQLVFRPVGCAALAMTALVSGCGGGGALTFQFPGPLRGRIPAHGKGKPG